MTINRMDLIALLEKGADVDFLREMIEGYLGSADGDGGRADHRRRPRGGQSPWPELVIDIEP